ncbi:PHB depolymerase family esterase [Aestuariibacter halophilus]|uniref:PHB depolymerase family esterase n=1 Tax=Fluctibacter halophilus TaxID=226011 RepID=A0ABS8G6D5_9ALTE|nr:PHB depolymerase family esterase [Aestuariibacter halophilus]MCC2616088.1 PHB depolymerase family esterase [Aestuariibacter halophilus]
MKRYCRSSLGAACLLLAIISGATHAGSWQNNQSLGGFNRVHIYTPDTTSAIGNGRALLVVLHGCTQSIDAFLTANLEDAAEQYGMVIAVPDAMNKAGFSCWSYWQGTKSRTAGDYKNLISLATTLTNNTGYNIDADQVYIAGLSSGAAFANTTACLAPDVFAGMGISAGPSIGTSSSGAIGTCESANVTSRCLSYAGSYASHFDSQIASIAHGDADTTVDTCYNRQNASGMAGVYGVTEIPGSTVLNQDGGSAEQILWQDSRVSMLWLNGVDHAWSGGQGASGSYISGTGINYASYLGQFFADNNPRVDRNQAPAIAGLNASENNSTLTINGTVSDPDGQVVQVDINISDTMGNHWDYSTQSFTNQTFTIVTGALADDLYQVDAFATDDNGAMSALSTTFARIGPPPPATAPQMSDVLVAVDGQCATVSGSVIDVNQDLVSVDVTFSTATTSADIQGAQFTAQACNLPGGSQTAVVTASDATNLSSATTLSFDIDAGQVATLDQHISAGRLDYTNYANCYLEYSTAAFKLNEITASGGLCQWQDNDASCVGPTQNCSTGGGSGGGGSGGGTQPCEAIETYNYYHKTAGRAYSTGNPYAPDYFANGSDEAMAGSTWGLTSLYSTDDSTWYVGSCPL